MRDFLLRDKISSFRGASVTRGILDSNYSEIMIKSPNTSSTHQVELTLSPNTSKKDLLKGQNLKLASNSILIPEIQSES